jgi:hypothetical protein
MRIILNAVAVAVTVMATTALIPQAKADRVCRQECSGPVCTEKCVETTDRDRERITVEGRGERREEPREDRHEEKREPGVDLKVPGVGIEIGR